MTISRNFLFGAFFLMVCGFVLPASAHKVVVSAWADGDVIEGEIGFSNGDMAVETVVEILDDNDNVIGETKTNEDGIFHFKPTAKIPLNFRANLGAGHVAFYRMEVDELPDGIGGDITEPVAVATPPSTESTGAVMATASGIDQSVLKQMIEAAVSDQMQQMKPVFADAVRKEVKPLRKVMFDYMEKNDLQAILGGIGYIVGLFGIGFYVAARMERRKHGATSSAEVGGA